MHLLVALKVYKELERMLKVSEIKMSVDKVLALAKTITTIQIKRPLNKDVYTQTMLMARHQKIAKLFDEEKKSATFFNAEVRGFSVLHDLCDSHGTNGYLLQQFFSGNLFKRNYKVMLDD